MKIIDLQIKEKTLWKKWFKKYWNSGNKQLDDVHTMDFFDFDTNKLSDIKVDDELLPFWKNDLSPDGAEMPHRVL